MSWRSKAASDWLIVLLSVSRLTLCSSDRSFSFGISSDILDEGGVAGAGRALRAGLGEEGLEVLADDGVQDGTFELELSKFQSLYASVDISR